MLEEVENLNALKRLESALLVHWKNEKEYLTQIGDSESAQDCDYSD